MRYLKTVIIPLTCLFQAPAISADWSGLYIGVNQVTKTVTSDWTTTETRNSLGFETDPSSDTEATFESEERGDGLRIGVNLNGGNWVFGLEAVKEAIKHEDSIDRIPGLGDPTSDPNSYVDFRAESDGVNLHLRAGYLVMPQLLFYLTAGKSELDVAVTSTCPADDSVCDSGDGTQSFTHEESLSDTAVGLGLEYQLFGFLLRAEYLEVDFGGFSFTAIPDQLGSSSGADATMGVSAELMQFGLAYQF